MSVFRTFWKWIFRGCLFVILVLVLGWVEMRVSRAYHLRTALQPPSAFIVEDAPLIALTHARVIDGTASSAEDDQTLVLNNGTIADFGPSSSVSVTAECAGHRSFRRADSPICWKR